MGPSQHTRTLGPESPSPPSVCLCCLPHIPAISYLKQCPPCRQTKQMTQTLVPRVCCVDFDGCGDGLGGCGVGGDQRGDHAPTARSRIDGGCGGGGGGCDGGANRSELVLNSLIHQPSTVAVTVVPHDEQALRTGWRGTYVLSDALDREVGSSLLCHAISDGRHSIFV